jgi:hypothetical protein
VSNHPLTPYDRTVRITSQLDEASREILRSVPQGFGGAFARKAVERLVEALEAGQAAPEAMTGGDPRPYAWKAPEALLDRAYAFVAGGRYGDESKDRPYLHLGYLVRAAIMLLSTTAAPAAFPGGTPMEDTTRTRYDDDTHKTPASPTGTTPTPSPESTPTGDTKGDGKEGQKGGDGGDGQTGTDAS